MNYLVIEGEELPVDQVAFGRSSSQKVHWRECLDFGQRSKACPVGLAGGRELLSETGVPLNVASSLGPKSIAANVRIK
jgi:hypothetical protein